MKDKAVQKQMDRVRPLVDDWAHGLGLGYYTRETLYYSKEKEFRKGNGGVAVFRVWADWRYLTFTISVNLPAVKRLNDNELEHAIVHELVHVLVNEMRETGINHEERTVTQLTKAFFWVRDLKPNGRV